MAIEPIGKTIETIFRDLSSSKQDNKQRAYDTFLALLDEKEKAHIEPWSLENGVLTVCVDSPARLYTLHLKKQKLLKILQDKTGPGIIERIRLKIGPPAKGGKKGA